jgi:hypothetical protein
MLIKVVPVKGSELHQKYPNETNPQRVHVPRTIKVVPVKGSELHQKYPNETDPQPVHVELDCRSGTLRVSVDGEIGNAVPECVWHGHVQRWKVPALRAAAANKLLAEIRDDAERVVAGYEGRWDGSNEVASFDEDALAAREAIEVACDRLAEDDRASLVVYSASEWFSTLGNKSNQAHELGITGETTDEQLTEIARVEVEGAGSEVDAIEGINEYLAGLREHVRREAADREAS